ncbi:MAG: hypothetical protein JO255_06470, partial [Alphaproteobacteria bacterium]|nr:hypothetical protein [Alphaproteobacteria bacterium]
MPDLLDEARRLMRSGGIIALSLDVFDTFLLRRTTTPEGVYEHVFTRLDMPGGAALREAFVQHRILAESKARRKKRDKYGATEVTIEQIYAEFPLHVFGGALTVGPSQGARSALVEAEFAAECELCFVNDEIFALYREARALGLRVGFISDTYWPRLSLEKLLRRFAPELVCDFVLPSCDHGRGKASGLFQVYLEQQRLLPGQALHIGDNPGADVEAPRRLGMQAIHYPQAPDTLRSLFQREAALGRLLNGDGAGRSPRLDGGLRAARRRAARQLGGEGIAPLIGATVLGPLLAGFQRFLENRLAALAAPGRKLEIVFLARDAFLMKAVWDRMTDRPAHYLEINRRVCMVGSSDEIEPLQEFFEQVPMVDGVQVGALLKRRLPDVEAFLDGATGGAVTGTAFAKVLPALIDDGDLRELSHAMRRQLLTYIASTVEAFDACTDLVLVDIGYRGSIQTALRGIFARAAIDKRIHGVYLLAASDAFAHLPDGDTAAGYLDDASLSPQAMSHVLRNVAVLEQLCCAPVGSVRHYAGAAVQREVDPRPAAQLALCRDVQRACLAFVDLYPALAKTTGADAFSDIDRARHWAAMLLTRFLLLPTAAEMSAFGGVRHEVNLGSSATIPLIDGDAVRRALGAMAFPAVCALPMPPMW